MPDIEVHIELDGRLRRVGLARCNLARGVETIAFEYAGEWLADPERFSIEPALSLTGTCSLDLLEAAAGYFSLGLAEARIIIKEVATVTATWRSVAKESGARSAEIERMASAFEHDDLRRGLAR